MPKVYGVEDQAITVNGKAVEVSSLEDKTVTYSANGQYTLEPESNMYGFKSVTVNVTAHVDTSDATAHASDVLSGKTVYLNDVKVGGTIPINDVDDLSIQDNTITTAVGYYPEAVSKSIDVITHNTPTASTVQPKETTINNITTIDYTTGVITANHTQALDGFLYHGTTTSTTEINAVEGGNEITPTLAEQVAIPAETYAFKQIKVKPMAYGTLNDPVITKSCNTTTHTATINATVENSKGYIPDYLIANGTQKNAQPITVTASELVSGNSEQASSTSNQTNIDVTNYSTISISPIHTEQHTNPVISFNDATGLITATHTQPKGYIFGDITNDVEQANAVSTDTEQLAVANGTTISPTEAEQTAINAKTFALGEIKVGAISSTYVGSEIPRQNSQTAEEESKQLDELVGQTVLIPAGYYAELGAVEVRDGAVTTPDLIKTITTDDNGIKTATITSSITKTEGYIYDGTVAGETETVTASEVTNGTKDITGRIAGYTNDQIVDVTNYKNVSISAIPPETVTNSIIAGTAINEDTSGGINYAWKTTVTIPTGYHEQTTLTKTFSDIFPTPENQASASELREGYKLYSADGTLLTGTMTEKAAGTYTASLNDQKIDKDQYLKGDQTIKAVSLTADANSILASHTVKIMSNNQEITSQAGNIPTRTDNDITVSHDTVSIEAGYYPSTLTRSKTVQAGTEGNPVISKSAVNNHTITVTAQVTNTEGYITGGTHSQSESKDISANELVSGNYTITQAGTFDVTNNATASLDLTALQTQIDALDTTTAASTITVDSLTTKTTNANTKIATEASKIASIKQALIDKAAVEVDPNQTHIDTSDANASAGDLLSGKTMYVQGVKITGTMANETKTATANNTIITPTAGKYLSQVNISIPSYDGTISGSSYIPVEYIESSGAQYINTGWTHKAGSTIILDCSVSASAQDSSISLFGSYPSGYSGAGAWAVFSRFLGSNYLGMGRTGSENYVAAMSYDTRMIIMSGGNSVSYSSNGSFVVANTAGTVDNGVSPMYLFGTYANNSCVALSKMKLYGARFYTNGVLERDYTPVKTANGVYGLYDTVTNTFLSSASNTAFTGRDLA